MENTRVSVEELERKKVLRKALEAIDSLQSELDAARRDRGEPIAIVGLSCRFPGAPNPEAYWELLHNGVDAIRQVPAGRWKAGKDMEPSAPLGGFLERVDLFDPGFFGISGREAESMDPQQRLVLEVAWEALEDAGIAANRLRGASGGVFIGITTSDYGRMAVFNNPASLDVYTATGGALNVAAGRLAFLLGMHGPAMAVDTACSSSLVATHLACQALRNRECDLALSGGVNALLTPEPFVCFTKWGMMARDGRCKAFDEAADGFVRAEGCGIIVLKRLSDALSAGDRILALIRGTAVNQDGATSGLTVPNGLAQQSVIRAALRSANLQPEDVDYVEAHGTGTTLGDPIELEALAAVLGKNRKDDRPLVVGSVKTNFGHLESASGIAGLIKIVLSLQHEEIPPHLHFKKLSPRISIKNAPIQVPVSRTAWPRSGRTRVAGVSSFGFSGTNAHAILQEAPAQPVPNKERASEGPELLVLSAQTEAALKELSKSYAEHFEKNPGLDWGDVCCTAAVGRSPFSYRLALAASTLAAARQALANYASGNSVSSIVSGRKRAGIKLAFLFGGDGAQSIGTGADLYRNEPAFRKSFDQCAEILRKYLDKPLHQVIGYADGNWSDGFQPIGDDYAQPALFAFEYALAGLWRSWGIEPVAAAGQGIGEYVAACVSGALSLEDALRLVVLRGRSLPGQTVSEAVHAEFERLTKASVSTAAIDFVSSPQFDDSIRALHARGIRTFLEIGPQAALTQLGRKLIDDPGVAWLAPQNSKQVSCAEMFGCLGTLYVLGMNPNWDASYKPGQHRRVSLPTYPFERKRFWLPEAVREAEVNHSNVASGVHPLLGTHLALAKEPETHIWQSQISLESHPWLIDHQVQGVAVVPATAFIEMVISAAAQVFSAYPVVISNISVEKVLPLQPGTKFSLQTRLERSVEGGIQFEIYSQRDGRTRDWTLHAKGRLSVGGQDLRPLDLQFKDIDTIRQRCPEKIDGSEFYQLHRERGNQWGDCFQGLRHVWRGNGEAISEVEAPDQIRGELPCYQLHPALSDAAGHVLTATIPLRKSDGNRGGAFVGAGVAEIRFYRKPQSGKLWAHARLRDAQQAPGNILIGDISLYDEAGFLVSETIGARLWYLDAAAKHHLLEDSASWLYEPRWINKSREKSVYRSADGIWIVFGDSLGVGETLRSELCARGAKCLFVSPAESLRDDGMSIKVRPDVLEDYNQVLTAAENAQGPIRGIVHLWSLDASDPETATSASVIQAQQCGPVSVLRLVQALASRSKSKDARIWLVTRGAQPSAEEPTPLSVLQSPVWGLGRTIAVEHSEMWGGQVDLDPVDATGTSARLLMDELLGRDGEDQLAFRCGNRRVLRLSQWDGTRFEGKKVAIRQDARYLITGGLGGIGLAVARWLSERGARHLVLVGRTPVPARSEWDGVQSGTQEASRIEAIRSLEQMGVEVQTRAVDISLEGPLSALMQELAADQHVPLRGVVHAAGIMQYQPLGKQSADEMRDVLGAKMTGGWLLHKHLAKAELDFFALFSSSSALLSSPMMGGYSAANTFLDALAHHRRALGLPSLSINWGTWGETGMATRFLSDERFKRQGRSGATHGMGTLSTAKALEMFGLLLDSGAAQAGVIPINWKEWRDAYSDLTTAPYLSLLLSESKPSVQPEKAGQNERERIIALPVASRSDALGAYLTRKIAGVLKVSVDSIDPENPLSSLGFDSLMSLELKKQIEKDLGEKVAMARLLEGPTVVELREILLKSLAEPAGQGLPSKPVDGITEWEEGQL